MGNKFNKTLLLFDYFKQAFLLNRQNKQLYRPQILYLLLKGALILLTFLSYLQIFEKVFPLIGNDFDKILSLFWSTFNGIPLTLTLLSLLTFLFGSTFVEAGLYYMYVMLVKEEDFEPSFMIGASRYFLPFLGGNILIFLFWMVALIPYLLIGMLTLTIGFFLIPLIVSIFLVTWKASLVVDEDGLWTSLKNSISFGKQHFLPLGVFAIIKSALSSASGGSAGGSNFSNTYNNMDSYNTVNEFPSGPNIGNFNEGADFFMNFLRIGGIVLISIISVTTIIAGMIQMLFDIFFGLCSVIIYVDQFTLIEQVEEEVIL